MIELHASNVSGGPKHPADNDGPDILGSLAFLGVHAGALLVFVAPFSWWAVLACVVLYVVRMFGITAGFHRYFSHRTFRTSRAFQFLLGFLGTSAGQLGPLWWAAHHRHHHKHSDTEEDIHSPGLKGVWYAHVGWILSPKYVHTNMKAVPDLAKFPELVWLNKHHYIAPLLLGVAVWAFGGAMSLWFPQSGIGPLQMLAWGFFLSTVLLYHGTFTINSLCHVFGSRRFDTGDHSRNNFWLALITLGEGWHNNHHHCPSSEKQGIAWYELDISHYVLRVLAMLGIVWDLKGHPDRVVEQVRAESRARHA